MRARYMFTLFLLTLILFGIPHVEPSKETYFGMGIQEVAGRPYLLLQEEETFSLYAPVGQTELQGWKQVFENRLGRAFGIFESPKGIEGLPPGLGVFFDGRYAVLDLEPGGTQSTPALPLGVDWNPRAAAPLNGALYAFGVKDDAEITGTENVDGILRVARLEGKKWVEPNKAALKEFHFTAPGHDRNGLWLDVLPINGRIAVIGRSLEYSQTLGRQVEDLRRVGEGDTWITYFDGEKFSPRIDVKNLPAGNGCVWTVNGQLRFLVQTRSRLNPAGNAPGPGRVEIWSIPDDGNAALVETVSVGRSKLGLINFIDAQRFTYAGREHVLRSTLQRFEVLRKDADNAWTPIPPGSSGLPEFSLERWLYAALGMCAMIVVFGAWLAYKRRRKAFAVLEKVRPDELLAPLSLRASACLLDWAIVLGATWLVARFDSEHFIDILPSLTDLPYTPFMLCSLGYFVIFERFFRATPGKLAMGLCVVGDNAQWPSFLAVLVRNIAGLYERHPLCLLIAGPMLLFSPRRQRIGDLLSRTVVVQRRGLERLLAAKAAKADKAGVSGESLLDAGDRKESN